MDGRRPSVSSLRGIVAAGHPQAAQAGAAILRAGGNAFDAAAATAAALNVTEPYMSGLAGMGMATCYIAAERRVRTLDFITRVPSEFPAGRFTSREELARGPIAAGTPGNLAGWCELVRCYGRKSLAEVFAPAIALARDGFPLVEYNVSAITDTVAEFKGRHAFYDDWARNYTGGGDAVLGSVLRQPELARTYEAIAAEGPRYLHGGALGQALVAHVRALGGCLTIADLESVEPVWLDPLTAAYRGLDVHTLPPPCEGFQYLLTLRILDGFDLASMERNGVEHLDAMYRAIRLAAGTRIAHNNPSAERLAALMSDTAVQAHAQACARWRADRRSDRAVRRRHAAAHDVVLRRRWRRQCRVHHPEPRREVRLRRGGAGIRRVPQQLPLLGRGRSARAECIAPRRTAGAADGTEHRHAQRTARAGARHAGQLRHLPDAAAGADPACRFRSGHPGCDRGAARAAV